MVTGRVELPATTMTIGRLAELTGVTTATLRAWETRHGFPRSSRPSGGHRRYTDDDRADVDAVLRLRAAGTALGVAIEEVLAARERNRSAVAATSGSIYAQLRQRHPGLRPHRLHKQTLLGLSWAIEDEFCSKANRATLFGSFQEARHWHRARDRWADLARTASAVHVFAGFEPTEPPTPHVQLVPVPVDSPMRREWTLVCDAPSLPVALTAWELPGQGAVPDRDRHFEACWTFDPAVVRDAARLCARLSAELGDHDPELATALDSPVPGQVVDVDAVSAMFERAVSYLDQSAFGSTDLLPGHTGHVRAVHS